jgi:hypothetical protein
MDGVELSDSRSAGRRWRLWGDERLYSRPNRIWRPMRVGTGVCVLLSAFCLAEGPANADGRLTGWTVRPLSHGPDEAVSVIVSVYVPAYAFAGMFSHQSVVHLTAPRPDVADAVAKVVGVQTPVAHDDVMATG